MSHEDEGRPLGKDMRPIVDRGEGNMFYFVAIVVTLVVGVVLTMKIFSIPEAPETRPQQTEPATTP